jgi:hypothetical protein
MPGGAIVARGAPLALLIERILQADQSGHTSQQFDALRLLFRAADVDFK